MNSDFLNNKEKAGNKSAFSFSPDFSIERKLLSEGKRIIAGFDEAGRGALAGPLSVGCAVFSSDFIESPDPEIFSLVNDSKKLSPKRRKLALEYIYSKALFAGVRFIPPAVIDDINVNRATELGVKKLVLDSGLVPDILIMDGNFSFDTGIPFMAVKKGDCLSLSIASASIAAKVLRDELMERMDRFYPGYGLAGHRGYGTASHMDAIHRLGPSAIHRKSYEPVKSYGNKF